MRRIFPAALIFVLAAAPVPAQDAIPERHMNAVNWMDFQRWVPSQIQTVLLPVGTLEAHGVVNNGADNTVPEAIARDLAARLNAMIAPTIPYGVTTSLSAFPGTFRVSPEVFKAYVKEVLLGLNRTGFRNLVVVNGHGPNFGPLEEACAEVAEATGARTLVFNWWTHTADVTMEVYGSDGGHAGVNENAAVLATNPEYVRPDLYQPDLAWFRQPGVSAYPYPRSIILYKEGEGYPDFDAAKARLFYSKALAKLETLVRTTIEKWDSMK